MEHSLSDADRPFSSLPGSRIDKSFCWIEAKAWAFDSHRENAGKGSKSLDMSGAGHVFCSASLYQRNGLGQLCDRGTCFQWVATTSVGTARERAWAPASHTTHFRSGLARTTSSRETRNAGRGKEVQGAQSDIENRARAYHAGKRGAELAEAAVLL